jgi:hypothetical protein
MRSVWVLRVFVYEKFNINLRAIQNLIKLDIYIFSMFLYKKSIFSLIETTIPTYFFSS